MGWTMPILLRRVSILCQRKSVRGDSQKMLLDVRGNVPYTIYLTNHVKRIDQFLAKNKPPKVKVVYAKAVDGVTSLRVDLGETLNS